MHTTIRKVRFRATDLNNDLSCYFMMLSYIESLLVYLCKYSKTLRFALYAYQKKDIGHPKKVKYFTFFFGES